MLKSYTEGKADFEVPMGLPITEILKNLRIPNELVAGVFVNDRAQAKDYLTEDGDVIKLIAVIGGGRQEE